MFLEADVYWGGQVSEELTSDFKKLPPSRKSLCLFTADVFLFFPYFLK